jgi:hypothetical protein
VLKKICLECGFIHMDTMLYKVCVLDVRAASGLHFVALGIRIGLFARRRCIGRAAVRL